MASKEILEVAKMASASFPSCPREMGRRKYHTPEACATKPARPPKGDVSRWSIYQKLLTGGTGAALVPDEETRFCPLYETDSLESPTAIKGFDTTWIVENTSSQATVISWVVDGVEISPFEPGLSAMDDPKCLLRPGDWISVPTFESFVYHVREVDKNGPGRLVLQHRAGMVPLGKPSSVPDEKRIDPEPFSPRSLEAKPPPEETGRIGTKARPCNIIDVGFRNQAGFPLSVYYAGNLVQVPNAGFSCSEEYHFHMGLNPAPQDFMWDWASSTKYEGSLIGHTFVARRADDPSVVVDSYTLEPTKIIDCPRREQQQEVMVKAPIQQEVDVQDGENCANSDATNDNVIGSEELLEGLSSASSRGLAAGLSGTSGFAN